MHRGEFCFAILATILVFSLPGRAQDHSVNATAHEIFKQLIEINTTDAVGNVTTAAEAMATRLRDAASPTKT
jgi:hypothetical protein